jgi:hypothetical protein
LPIENRKSKINLLVVTVLFWAASVNAQPYPVGDLDGDRDVDFEDLQILASQWLDEACPVAECEADLNGSSTVDSADFALLAQNWLAQTTTPVISEFMASNGSRPPPNPPRVGDLLDEDRDSSDWIEIYNPTDGRFDISGWHLTDDRNVLAKWEFPDGIWLDPGQFLIVFASGKNRAVAGSELHTNFQLDADNPEYLALVERDGRTIAHEYAPTYPRQLSNISYGLRQYSRTLVAQGATASYHVPTIEDAGTNWTARAFDDSAFDAGPTGLGFGFGGVPRAAYNDCVYAGSQYIGQNVTTYGIGNGFAGKTSGPLIDQATGDDMGITVTLTQSGGVNWQSDPGAGGRDCAVGTDAYTTFGGIADMTGVIYYGSAGWWVDITFTGLDAGTEYTFAASSARCSYDDRRTIYTLTGADTYANASTSGVDVLAENKVRFNSGDNYSQGYVARWTGLTASDGSFTVRAEADPSSPEARKAYSFDVFMLAGGFAGSDIQQKMLNNNASLWTRIKFELADGEVDLFDTLTLRMRYEDGFVAYLNGVEVARSNFEGPAQWNSSATVNRQNGLAMEFVSFDISGAISLLRQGTNVLAIHALNDKAGDGDFLILPELIAASSMGVPQYFTQATPGKFNVPGAIDVVADTKFSRDRGFYDAPFLVSITTETEGATIHYTTDGSTPTEVRGQPYAGPIPIARTTCLRAMAFKPGWISTNVDTQTYIFPADVIRQPANPAGFPASWGGTTADYAMDSRVVNDPQYRGLMRDSLLSLPTISIVTDLNNLFGAAGIYDNSTMAGVAWERPASIEWINPDGATGFHVNAGLRIYGGDPFRGMGLTRKKSFRLLFKRQYGPAKLDFPMFDVQDAATGASHPAESFDTIVLRAGANDGWNNWGNVNTQYIIDEFMRRTQLALGQVSPHGTFVHLYINGLYWGLYNSTERPMASFCATYYGGDKEEWDALNSDTPTGESNTTTWNAMLSQAAAGLSDNASYQKIQGNNPDGTKNPAYDDLLDIDNYIDWLFSNFWGGTGDWPYHNYYVGCRRPPNATGFKFFNWDGEGAIIVWSSLNANVTGASDGGARPYVTLRQNDEFRLLFADHAHRHLFNNGPATSQASYTRYKDLADQIELAIIAESARWGDQAQSTPYTLADWRKTRDYILGTYMPQRPGIVLQQIRDAGLYPSVDAPVFVINGVLQYGGHISPSGLLMMTAPKGQIYYTLDGSDPRIPTAQSAPGAAVTLVAENAAKRVLVPSVANGGNLLGNKPAEFQVTFYQANRTVSSLDIAETVISNPSYRTTVVTQMAPVINFFNTDVGGNFAADKPFPGTTINVNVDNFVILVTGTIIIPSAGPWTFGVSSDDGFGLKLTGTNQTFSLSYPDPRSPGDSLGVFNVTQPGPYQLRLVFYEQGGGSELELYAAKGSYSTFSSNIFRLLGDLATGIQVGQGNIWFTGYFNDSTWPTGSGGVGYEKASGFQGLIGRDVGAEMYNTYTTCYIRIPFTAGNAEYGNLRLRVRYDDGFIAYLNGAEVARRNFTGEPAWNSAAAAQHPDNAAVVFEEINISDYATALSYGSNVLAIHGMNSAAGDDDFLISAEMVANKMTQGDISPGALEYKNPIALTKSTHIKARALDGKWSALNEAVFAVGPVAENLRITEIMYHPAYAGDPNDQNAEFIELTNVGAESINLNLVRFTEGIQFIFPDLQLAPSQYVLVVKDRSAFGTYYPDCSAIIAGQYEGSLDNAGERIKLEDAIGEIILDFEYKDGWYDVTDGDGFSLTIINPGDPDANNWGLKDAWRPSALFAGSPGYDDAGIVPNPGSVVINEVLAHSHGVSADWIELHNTTGAPISIGGWFLSDSDQDDLSIMKYRIADGTTIEPNGYIVFYEDQHFGPGSTDPGRLVPFALSENGDKVVLTSAVGDVLTGYRDVEDFDASQTDVSFGRYRKSGGTYNFVPLSFRTPGSANAYPMVGPIVINEIMYNPDPPANSSYDNDDFEYIELHNISDVPVTLYDAISGEPWKFTDGIEFSFPTDPPVTIQAGGYLLIVKNPEAFRLRVRVEAAPAESLAQRWQAIPADKVLGPYEGRLDNSGEKVEISKPGDVDQFGTRYYIRVDRVNYSDGSHPVGEDLWPSQADGGGKSLTRKVPQEYGNDVVNWKAGEPSPGAANP